LLKWVLCWQNKQRYLVMLMCQNQLKVQKGAWLVMNFWKQKLNSDLKYMCFAGLSQQADFVLCLGLRNKLVISFLVLIVKFVLMRNFNLYNFLWKFGAAFYYKLITYAMCPYNFSLEYKSSWIDLYFLLIFAICYVTYLSNNSLTIFKFSACLVGVVFGEIISYFSKCLIELTKICNCFSKIRWTKYGLKIIYHLIHE